MRGFISTLFIAHPDWLAAIPVCLLALAWLLWRWPACLADFSSLLQGLSQRTYRHPAYAQLKGLSELGRRQNPRRNWLKRYLSYGILLALVFIALAQPYRLGKRLPTPQKHRDILFLVDTSLNMILRDYLVNGKRTKRITMLKVVLNQFIQKLHGDRIGLIIFSEQPYYYVPLTNDYHLLAYQIQRLRAAVLTGRTSDISRALLYSLRWINKDQQQTAGPKPELVLISDANRTARHIDPRAAARYLAQRGITVQTIAIGAASDAAREKGRLALIYHPASFYLLQGIAKAGDGQFFWAKDEASLQRALRTIEQAKLREVKTQPQYIKQPLYMWPLLLALIWITAWQLSACLGRRP